MSKKLNIPHIQSTYQITGVGNTVTQSLHSCEVNIRSLVGNYNKRINCLILPDITSSLPVTRIDSNSLNLPENTSLADPTFCIPSQIDLLIGADYFWDLLLEGKIKLPSGPYLQNTRLGWIIAGPIYAQHPHLRKNIVHCHFVQTLELNEQLKKFWEIEECSNIKQNFSKEELQCEKLFSDTTKRLPDGRFSVRIPLKESADSLGDSYIITRNQFLHLERKLDRQPTYKKMYSDFMQEYLSLGHMTRIDNYSPPYYFLPHHGVFREQSLTTKLRVVFNASQKTMSGKSLNDIQLPGPALQNDLVSILLRFRQYKYVACADIEKMFRQILIQEDLRNLQLILWRESSHLPLSVYRLNTVTYGTASAPFLSIRCVRQLGLECENHEISRTILEDFYVDDLITDHDNKEQLQKICQQVSEVCSSGCFPLRKWVSNCQDIIQCTAQNMENTKFLSLDENVSCKTLGLGWFSKNDELYFTTKITNDFPKVTKRIILSVISQIYDPLGLLSPAIILAKVMLQRLWLCKVGWDDNLPQDILSSWEKFVLSLANLNSFRIPRHVLCDSPKQTELHIFSDASQTAYGACAYIRTCDSGNHVTVKLLCSKTRVAPVKPVSIPRLELCGALVGATLQAKIVKSLHIHFHNIVFWTDSTIVLAWLNTPPNQLKTFVQNRVVEINELTTNACWFHVQGKNNPADLLSRGLYLNELSASTLWWTGPAFLQENVDNWAAIHDNRIRDTPRSLPEVKNNKTVSAPCLINNCSLIDFNRFSSYNRLQRACAYAMRFIHNLKDSLKNNACNFLKGPLSVSELNNATLLLTKIAQRDSFPNEYNLLKNNLPIKSSRNVSGLNLFLDENDLVRVGGRLENSDFSYNKKHPLLLCSKHRFTILLFRYEHLNLLHAGPQLLLSNIRESWWPLGGRNLSKKIVRECVKCCRLKATAIQPIMGNLPRERITPDFPFIYCGVDYAGPMYTLNRKGRGAKLEKCYICLFVCFITKALHLELVTSLSSEGYIMALKRFISRRGKPRQIYSDHGRNFVGAVKEFTDFLNKSSNDVINFASNNQIEFKFIPPYAPHFGGLWEAGVKSCKHHIARIVGKANLTYEEFSTVLVQIEAVLNSRPMSADPEDFNPLTPAHFLIGRPLTSPAADDVTTRSVHSMTRFQRLEQIRQQFWRRWSTEYVSELQRRTKWKENKDNLSSDTLVLVKEDNLAPLHWRLGRIVSMFPGKDGISRVATIRTATGIIQRAFSKICPLPVSTSVEPATVVPGPVET